MFKCPKCDFETESTKGWKQHLSKSHGGWKPEEWDAAAAAASARQGAVASGHADFADAARAAPDTDAPSTGTTPGEPTAKRGRRPIITREFADQFESMRGEFASGIGKIFAFGIDHQWPEEKLSEDEMKALKEACEFPMKALAIDFAIEPIAIRLTSIFWTLLIPLLMASILALKRIKFLDLFHGTETESDRGNYRAERGGENPPGGEAVQ